MRPPILGLATALLLLAGCSGVPAPAAHPAASSPSLPAPSITSQPAVRSAEASVVKVEAVMPGCARDEQTSGFVFAAQHVLTAAHGVAGAQRGGLHVISSGGRSYAAKVVRFDPRTDVAVLDVPGLSAPALRFAGQAAEPSPRSGPDTFTGAILAYPNNGARPAMIPADVIGQKTARGPDLFGGTTVLHVFALLATLPPGSAGGPLLNLRGQVAGAVVGGPTTIPGTIFVLATGQVKADAAAGADDTARVSDQTCVS
jgi:S1-C subfamily serine protease